MTRLATRRTILLSLAAAVLLDRSFYVGNFSKNEISGGDLVKILQGCQCSANNVGGEYLRCVPIEADKARLVSLICNGDGAPALVERTPEAIREWTRAKIRDDFGAGRIVQIGGWILSETEARLCALSALS